MVAFTGMRTVDGDRFTATVITRRTAGHGLVGADEVELSLEGTSKSDFAHCSGLIDGASDIKVEVTLIPVRSRRGSRSLTAQKIFTGEIASNQDALTVITHPLSIASPRRTTSEEPAPRAATFFRHAIANQFSRISLKEQRQLKSVLSETR
jgi:hypothetical protein